MKIAVPSTAPDLGGNVAHKLGTAPHMLVIETGTMAFTAMDGPPPSTGPGAGVLALSMVMDMGAEVLLVDHLAPHIAGALRTKGVDVRTGTRGPVAEVLAAYMKEQAETGGVEESGPEPESPEALPAWSEAAGKAWRQFASIMPMLAGVVLLLGLVRGFVSDEMLNSLFTGSPLMDSLCGALIGGVMAGNPVNSYVIGHSLLGAGVGQSGAAALMLAWVGVGLVQLPAEGAALGWRFAVVRNMAGLVMAAALAMVLVSCLGAWS